jgi:peptidoglycan/LPS O-acetylase OafA/YrhL
MVDAVLPASDNDGAFGRKRRELFVTLDGMRGVAALMVVFWHSEYLTGFRPQSGYLAVDLFFVLSGFVIAHSYDQRLEKGMGWLAFMRVRFIRLYPLYFAGMVLASGAMLASMAIGAKTNWRLADVVISLAFSLLALPSPELASGNHLLFPLNSPAWSLFFEWIINLLYAVFFFWLSIRRLAVVAVIGAISLMLVTTLYHDLNTGFFWSTALGGVPRVVFSFTAGVLLLRVYKAGRIALRSGAFVPMLLTFAVLCYGPPEAWRPAYDLFASLVVFPLLTLAGASSQPSRAIKPFEMLGAASYPIYILHVPLLGITVSGLAKVAHVDPAAFAPWGGFAFVLFALVVSWTAVQVYDIPVRRLLSERLGSARRLAAARHAPDVPIGS